MTNPIRDMVRAWLDVENVDHDHYNEAIRPWVAAAYHLDGDLNPVHLLERGECTTEEFERLLAARMVCRDGRPVSALGLLDRMFAASSFCDPMHAALLALRKAGLRTGLLSNSWGMADYPRHLFPAMFDVVVISGEVGMRKPEERIYRHAAGLLGLAPGECIFIDDAEANVAAAEALGMTGVLHTEASATLGRLDGLLGLTLSELGGVSHTG
jgi:putative hydrolase of the HAD superfamily